MARFRGIKTLQMFTSAHASIHDHFNRDRHLSRRVTSKHHGAAALAEWRELAAWSPAFRGYQRLVRMGLTPPVGGLDLQADAAWQRHLPRDGMFGDGTILREQRLMSAFERMTSGDLLK